MNKRSPIAPLVFLAETFLAQMIGIGAVIITFHLTDNRTISILVGSFTAYLSAIFLEFSLPWQILNTILIPSAVLSLTTETPAWLFLGLFVLLTTIYAPALWTRVPYYPTNRSTYAVLLAQLPHDKPFTFIDIGCGFGDLLLFLVRQRPSGLYTGVEIGILPFICAYLRALIFGRGRVKIRFQSMWKINLAEWEYVYAFLSPAPMTLLWSKAKKEMVRGSTFITNSFKTPEQADQELRINDQRKSVLYLHQF